MSTDRHFLSYTDRALTYPGRDSLDTGPSPSSFEIVGSSAIERDIDRLYNELAELGFMRDDLLFEHNPRITEGFEIPIGNASTFSDEQRTELRKLAKKLQSINDKIRILYQYHKQLKKELKEDVSINIEGAGRVSWDEVFRRNAFFLAMLEDFSLGVLRAYDGDIERDHNNSIVLKNIKQKPIYG